MHGLCAGWVPRLGLPVRRFEARQAQRLVRLPIAQRRQRAKYANLLPCRQRVVPTQQKSRLRKQLYVHKKFCRPRVRLPGCSNGTTCLS
jgi:hypothetical protein